MSIHEEIAFDKAGKPVPGWRGRELVRRLFVPLAIILIGFLGYGLGRLSGGDKPGVKIEYDPNIISALSTSTPAASASGSAGPAAAALSGEVVYASSKGTKYYYAGCHNTISAANKVSFPSASAAEAAGYTLASGCHK